MFKMRAKIITVGLLGAAALLPIDFAKADQLGHASWYSLPANMTANGERMNPDELTAAHRSLPFGTRVLVENLYERPVRGGANQRSRTLHRGAHHRPVEGRGREHRHDRCRDCQSASDHRAGGNALAALGRDSAKAKDGASLTAKAKVEIASAETPRKTTAEGKSSQGQAGRRQSVLAAHPHCQEA